MQFEPPRTATPPPPIEPVGFFTGVEIRPIIIGVVVDYVATLAAMYAYVFIYLSKRLAEQGEVSEEAIYRFLLSDEGLLIGFAIGTLCTVLGGYMAGSRASRLEIKHGALVGFGSLVVSFIEQYYAGETMPIPEWYRLLGYLAIIPAGAVGGYIAQFVKGTGGPYNPTPNRRSGIH
jgi:hypothetical protein